MIVASLRGVWKSYGRDEVLRGVDLDVKGGEAVVVLGRSGAGKTTLIRVLGLLTRPDRGVVELFGVDTTRLGDRERSRLRLERIGIVFQSPSLIPTLTVIENVTLPLALRGVPRSVREERGLELLRRLGIGHLADKYPSQLSGGEARRAAVARALIKRADLLLADEPTAGLDEESAGLVLDLLEEEAGRGAAVVVTSTGDEVLPRGTVYRLVEGRLVRA